MDALDVLGLCLSHIGTHLDIMEGIPDSNNDTPKNSHVNDVTLKTNNDHYTPGAQVFQSHTP